MMDTTYCDKGHDAAMNAITSQVEVIIAQAPGVASLDIDAIHDMRVASRRLRMALDVFRPFLPRAPRKTLRRLVRSITRDLGMRRELDVMTAMMRDHRDETHGVWQRFMDHAILVLDRRRDDQASYCRDASALAASEAFRAAVDTLHDQVDASTACLLETAEAGLLGALAEARAARREWKRTADPEALHLVRIALKHLRYACEFHAPCYGQPMAEHIEDIKAAQEILGEWNECRLLEDMVLALGGAAEYSLAQGAPLVAEAYRRRAGELADQFGPMGKALLGRKAAKRFAAMVALPDSACCRAVENVDSTTGGDAACVS